MNEAISALAASNTTETLAAVALNIVASAEKIEDEVETNVTATVGSVESEVAKVETETKTETVAAEIAAQSELDKIEDAALSVVRDITQKARNVFVDAVIKNPAIVIF